MRTTLARTGDSATPSSASTLIPVQDIDAEWNEAEPHIERVRQKFNDKTSLLSIYRDLKKGSRQLWVVKNAEGKTQAAILTLINDYYGELIGVLTHAAGEDFKAWESAVEPIGDYFRLEGCSRFVIYARPGWKKFLEEREFRQTDILLEKSLNG